MALTDDTSLGEVEVDTRTLNAAYAAGLITIGDVRRMPAEVLRARRGFGWRRVRELRDACGIDDDAQPEETRHELDAVTLVRDVRGSYGRTMFYKYDVAPADVVGNGCWGEDRMTEVMALLETRGWRPVCALPELSPPGCWIEFLMRRESPS